MFLSCISELEEFNIFENNLLTQTSNDFNFWLNRVKTIYEETIERSKFQYRQYQVDYASVACLRRRNILAHSQGAGKTATAGLTIAAIYNDIAFSCSRVHILVPNILAASRWLEDLNYIPNLEGLSKWINSTKDLDKAIENQVPIFIYTYDFLKKKYKDKCLAKYFSKHLRPSMVVIDELHNLANTKADRTRKVNILTRKTKRVLGLTGTISDGRLEQISSLCKLVYRSQWEFTEKSFLNQYGKRKKLETNYLTGEVGEGNRYLNQLDQSKVSEYYNLIKRFLHRVTLDDPQVKSSIVLPRQNNKVIEFELESELKSKYNFYIDTYKQQLKLVAEANKSNSARFQALKIISPLITLINSPKNNYVSTKLNRLKEELSKYNKVVIFTHRIESARYLEENLLEYSTVRLYSQDDTKSPKVMPLSERYEVVRKFQQDKNVKVGIFSVGLAAESIDLTAGDAVFFYCLPWQSIKILQSISRVVRPGNLNQEVDILYFCYANAIDKHQVNLALQKINRTKMLLDYDGIEVTEEDSFSDLNPLDILTEIVKSF